MSLLHTSSPTGLSVDSEPVHDESFTAVFQSSLLQPLADEDFLISVMGGTGHVGVCPPMLIPAAEPCEMSKLVLIIAMSPKLASKLVFLDEGSTMQVI